MLFYVGGDARFWAHWNHSFDIHLHCLEPVSCVFSSWVSSDCAIVGNYPLMTAWWQAFLPSILSSLKVHHQGGQNHWWLPHPFFTDVAGIILFPCVLFSTRALPLFPSNMPHRTMLPLKFWFKYFVQIKYFRTEYVKRACNVIFPGS